MTIPKMKKVVMYRWAAEPIDHLQMQIDDSVCVYEDNTQPEEYPIKITIERITKIPKNKL